MKTNRFEKKFTWIIIVLTVLLGLACLYLDVRYRAHGVLMLALVTLGTAFDFSLSVVGDFVKSRKTVLLLTRWSFSLLNFGVVFTALSAAYVVRNLPGCRISQAMVSGNHVFLLVSVASGMLFLFTRYVPNEKVEGLYTLDRSHGFTRLAFILRRIILAGSLGMALIVVFEAVRTPYAGWAVLFIATVPLHILHKHMLSMTAEFLTLAVLFCGTFVMLVS